MKRVTIFVSTIMLVVLMQAQKVPGTFWSSWIGNTYGGKVSSTGAPNASDPNDKWIQDYINCMNVTEDGTCYTTSSWDEAHREYGIYKNGDVLGNKNMNITCGTAGGFSISGKNIVGNNKTITTAGTPKAIAMGRGAYLGKLLVADNGQRKQILVYDTTGTPTIIETIGAVGGIASDFTSTYEFPAAINAPAYPAKNYGPGYYHPFKLWGLTGVGCDTLGRIFVSTSEMGSAIRCFKKVEGNWILDWRVENYFFVDNVYYDEETDAAEIYGVQEHFKLDLSKKAAGKEWSILGYTLDSYSYPNDPRGISEVKSGGEHGLTAIVMRKINGTRYLWSHGMTCQPPNIYKFKAGTDIAVPCGLFMGSDIRIYNVPNGYFWPPQRPATNTSKTFYWGDANNDGDYQSNEYTILNNNSYDGGDFYIDKQGNLWQGGNPLKIWKVTFDANGNIKYPEANIETIPILGVDEIGKIILQEEYDRLMVLSKGCREIDGGKMYSIDNWSKGNRIARFIGNIKGPHQSAWTVAGDYAFEAGYESFATVWVTDLRNGMLVGTMIPDASCGGLSRTGWVDISSGIQAYKRASSGEYLVFVEDDLLSRVIMYRWCPLGNCVESDVRVSITEPSELKAYNNYTPLFIEASVKKDTSTITKVDFYANDLFLGSDTTLPYNITWNNPKIGRTKIYAKATTSKNITSSSNYKTIPITNGSPIVKNSINNTVFSLEDTVIINTHIIDDGSAIDSVVYYANNKVIFVDYDSAYTCNWVKKDIGVILLQAVVYDNSGKNGTSEITVISVNNYGIIDNTSKQWTWKNFSYDACGTCYKESAHSTFISNSTGEVNFTGSTVQLYCETWSGGGSVNVYIDGVLKGLYSQKNQPYGGNQLFATISGLTNTQHVLKVVSVGIDWVGIDYIKYYSDNNILLPMVGTSEFKDENENVKLHINSAEWKHFPTNNHKSYGVKTNSISNYSIIGNNAGVIDTILGRHMSWTGGTPEEIGNNNKSRVFVSGIGNGFKFTVPANNDIDTLKVYVGGKNANGILTAHLSNNASLDYISTPIADTETWNIFYNIIYNAKKDGEFLEVKWFQASGEGSINLQGAAIFGRNEIAPKPIIVDNIVNKSNISAFQIYPNPATNMVTISFKSNINSQQTKVAIFDLLGKNIFKTIENSNYEIKINTESFAKGIYFIHVTKGIDSYTEKLILK